MSTRARIRIVDCDTGEENFLYRGCDGYPSGLGVNLVRECDLNGSAPDLDSFTFKLLKGNAGLETDLFGDDALIDWFYTIEWASDAIGVFAQHVDLNADKKLSRSMRLAERIDMRQYVAELREKERRRDLLVAELRGKLGPCPLCGSDPDPYVSVGGAEFSVRCSSFFCKKRKEIEVSSVEELMRAWRNQGGCGR